MNEKNLTEVYWLASNLAQSASSLSKAGKEVLESQHYVQVKKEEFNEMLDELRMLINE